MVDYATARKCRHRLLASHLGERIENCGTSCDHCSPRAGKPAPEKQEEARELPANAGQVIIECLASFPFRPGKPSVVKALTGSAASNVAPERVRHFGSMSGAVKSSVEAAIDSLVEQSYIESFKTEEGYVLLRATERAEDGVPAHAVAVKPKKEPRAKAEKRDTRPQPPMDSDGARPYTRSLAPQAEPEDGPATPEEADLFERLRAWRRVVANKQNLPPFVIMHDATLWRIARARPGTGEELAALRGIGQTHIQKYGADILKLVAE
jgi:superfamily II DNA helicase RecQ